MGLVKKIHKWASVIVGLQLLIWLATGLYFNLMDHHKAGGHQYRAHLHQPLVFDHSRLVEPQQLLENSSASTSIKLINLLGKPYYLMNHEKGLYPHFNNRYSLYHAYTGELFKIDRTTAIALAEQSYNGPGEVESVSFIGGKNEDLPKQKNPSWQVSFNDEVNTRVYVEAQSGRITGHSDDDSRFAGIFFMLHFMDYANEGSFNNWQIIAFGFITLWLSFTGMIWTINLLQKRQYKLKELKQL
ncbi:PepSY domain-containing protein [Thalassotalea sp. LPB0316]|uniref:PepSY domain-containing protein n=1 Tax=Thalassotalea sp. LPB0316 TaxID=2769490 RepID=UPI0018692600|nr:PepSY domain-containing protein [Thalassotalea sp. LPB0316]QOL25647.1 PepSY domain-containing protein [Thalassotalea sp. LPB0316]